MKTRIGLTVATVVVMAVGAETAAAQPGDGSPASCLGYLASNANPNNGVLIQELVKPLAESLGVTLGALQSGIAAQHAGSLNACIP